jgi:hypothetical protein
MPQPQIEAGYRLHGGFDADGKYISPRTLHRWPAIRAWSEALTARGHDLVDSSQQLLVRGNFPTVAQQKFLLDLGLGRTLWNSLTVVGVIEARGRGLADATAPDFQAIVAEDISQTATGHLNKGLLARMGWTKAAIRRAAKADMIPCGSPCAICCSARMPIHCPKFRRASGAPRSAG